MNTAARLFLAYGSALVLIGCNRAPKDAGVLALRYRDPSLPGERHQGIEKALKDLSGGNPTQRTQAEEYLTTIGPALEGRLTPYVAQLLKSQSADIRDSATRILILSGGPEATPYFIDFLTSPNNMVRRDTAAKLRLLTGKTFDYRYDAPEEERKAAIELWRKWWEDQAAPARR